MEDLSACKSKPNLIRIYTVNRVPDLGEATNVYLGFSP
jgi:hypothetical protein